jgi:hypothetical protein
VVEADARDRGAAHLMVGCGERTTDGDVPLAGQVAEVEIPVLQRKGNAGYVWRTVTGREKERKVWQHCE